jgi:hypothetical protein
LDVCGCKVPAGVTSQAGDRTRKRIDLNEDVDAGSIPEVGFELESVKRADVRSTCRVGLSHYLAFPL